MVILGQLGWQIDGLFFLPHPLIWLARRACLLVRQVGNDLPGVEHEPEVGIR